MSCEIGLKSILHFIIISCKIRRKSFMLIHSEIINISNINYKISEQILSTSYFLIVTVIWKIDQQW